jgi:predicted PurR-regulated permease PerM
VPADADDSRRLVLWTIAVLAFTVILLWAAYQVRHVLLLVYVSALFAIGFSPLVRWIERQRLLPIGTRRFPRWLAILVVYLAIIGVLATLGVMVVPALVQQARELWTELPNMLARGQRLLLEWGILDHPLTVWEAVQHAPGTGTDAVGTVLVAVWGFVGGLFGLVTILILTFYLLIESESLFNNFVGAFPRRRRPRIAAASREIAVKVSAWLTGQLLLAGVIGTSAAIALWIMGVPYFYVLALIAGIGEMIPIVGPVIAAIPAVIVAATESLRLALIVVVFFVIQQQFENHVLVPKIMERQVGVSAVTVIIALLIGGSLLGVVGAILAVPTAAIVQVLYLELMADRDE